jgi:hypothetical protein
VSWLSIALLACAVLVLIGAEWPRLTRKVRMRSRERRDRARKKDTLRLIQTESEEFAASVERDLSQLPTIEEHDRKTRRD